MTDKRGNKPTVPNFPLFSRLARYRAAIDYARRMLLTGKRADIESAIKALDAAVEGNEGRDEPTK